MEESVLGNKIPCGCGCGSLIEPFDKWHHRPRQFVQGHTNRGKKFTRIEKYNMLCSKCGSKTSLNKIGNPIWYHRDNGDPLCRSCWDKERYWTDLEYAKARATSYRQRSRTKILDNQADYREKNRGILNQKRLNYYYEHREEEIKKRILRNRKSGQIAKIIRYELVELLGGKCVICGYDKDKRALCLDHINSGGGKDRLEFTSPTKYYRHYFLNLDIAKTTLQVLCSNCNVIKIHEKGESLRSKLVGVTTKQ
jgi:hypothetical protein